MSLPNTTNTVSAAPPVPENEPHLNNNVRGAFNYKDYYQWMNGQLTPRISSLAVALLGNPTSQKLNRVAVGQEG